MAKIYVSLPLDEESKLIIEALNNDVARKILEALSDGPLSISQLASKLSAPITTVQYNVDKLLKAGLIKIGFVKFSEKRRIVRYYELEDKLIVIAPRKRSILKDLSFVLTALVVSVFIGLLVQEIVRPIGLYEGVKLTSIALSTQGQIWPWFLILGMLVVLLSYVYKRFIL